MQEARHKFTYAFVYNAHCSSQILMKLKFSLQMFEKYSTISFH